VRAHGRYTAVLEGPRYEPQVHRIPRWFRVSHANNNAPLLERSGSAVVIYSSRSVAIVILLFLFAACERQRVETQKRARALELNGVNDLQPLPKCDPLGDFEPVQCDPLSGNCFCVDESGFELAGTRARSLDIVNCTSKLLSYIHKI